jgi:NAD-dependent dihydropyrimidine dehydrogenase PreA subunit
VEINTEICNECGQCVYACPQDAIVPLHAETPE